MIIQLKKGNQPDRVKVKITPCAKRTLYSNSGLFRAIVIKCSYCWQCQINPRLRDENHQIFSWERLIYMLIYDVNQMSNFDLKPHNIMLF